MELELAVDGRSLPFSLFVLCGTEVKDISASSLDDEGADNKSDSCFVDGSTKYLLDLDVCTTAVGKVIFTGERGAP